MLLLRVPVLVFAIHGYKIHAYKILELTQNEWSDNIHIAVNACKVTVPPPTAPTTPQSHGKIP